MTDYIKINSLTNTQMKIISLIIFIAFFTLRSNILSANQEFPARNGEKPVILESITPDTPFVARNFAWASGTSNPYLSAVQFLQSFPEIVGVEDPHTDLEFESATRFDNHTVLKFNQTYKQIEVFGRGVIVKVDESGTVYYIASNAVQILDFPSEEPLIDSFEASLIALQSVPGIPVYSTSAKRFIFAEKDHSYPIWVFSIGTKNPLGSWLVLVNGISGEVINIAKRTFNATGRVFEQNPNNGGLIEPELLHLSGDGTRLNGQYATTYRYISEGNIQTAIPDSDGNFLYNPSSTQPDFEDPFVEVQSYYHVDRIVDYFVTTHGYTQTRGPLTVLTNYYQGSTSSPTPYDNAAYDGENWTLTIGQGSTADFGYDATIIYHEVGHSVIDSIAQLLIFGGDKYGMILMPGAIHEGVSDYFAASLLDDPNMNEYIYIGRNLQNDHKCPEDMIGEPHQDGLVVGGTLWDIRELLGKEISDRIVYRALFGLPQDTSFKILSNSVMDEIDQLITEGTLTEAEKTQVETIFQERGMDICDRFIDLKGAESYSTLLFGLSMMGESACDYISYAQALGLSMPTAFQWYIDVPEDATTLKIDFSLTLFSPGEEQHWLYLRKEEPVEFELVSIIPGLVLPLRVQKADKTFEMSNGFTLTPYTDPPVEPGKRYYVAISSLSCPMGRYTISGSTGNEPVEEPVVETEEEEPEVVVEEEADAVSVEELDAISENNEEEMGPPEKGDSGCGCKIAE